MMVVFVIINIVIWIIVTHADVVTSNIINLPWGVRGIEYVLIGEMPVSDGAGAYVKSSKRRGNVDPLICIAP